MKSFYRFESRPDYRGVDVTGNEYQLRVASHFYSGYVGSSPTLLSNAVCGVQLASLHV